MRAVQGRGNMNRIQYRRWKDFALRMADHGWPSTITRTKQHKEIVRPAVEHFFGLIEHNQEPARIRIESWDDNRPDYRGAKRFDWGYMAKMESCVGDEANRIIEEYRNPFSCGSSDRLYEKWDEQWGARIRCCIRAGLDLVAEPSGGVVGFRKKDIERMYPDGVPKWIREPWGHQNGAWRPVQWEDMGQGEGLWL